MRPELRPATTEDIERVLGGPSLRTLRAVAVVIDGKAVGFGGVAYQANRPPYLVSQVTNECRKYPRAIVEAAHHVLRTLAEPGMLCVADPKEPTAPRFLRHLGFHYIEPSALGDLYRFGGL